MDGGADINRGQKEAGKKQKKRGKRTGELITLITQLKRPLSKNTTRIV